MKKSISVMISIVMLFCIFSFNLPSFALTDSDFVCEFVNEKIVITGYTGSKRELTIPAEIYGKPVVKIGNNAFIDNEILTRVIISEGVEDIGDSAFQNCINLSEITLPKTITHIGENAIFNTSYYNNKNNWKLKRTVEDTDFNIGSGTQETIPWEDVLAPTLQYLYLGTALIECEYSGFYRVKHGTTVIADYAFQKSEIPKKIEFPQSLVAIGKYAFDGCISLENFDISENVEIDATSFYNTGFYNNFKNWESNALYIGSRLVVANGEEILVKDGTTQIVSGALNGKNVVIPKSVISIHENAFTSTENVIIFGYTDTFAQTYANENHIKFIDLENIIKGDVNFNGDFDAEDYKILYDISILEKTPSFVVALAGDMNADGAIDNFDIIILDLFINNMEPSTIKGDTDGNGEVNEEDYYLLATIATQTTKIKNNYMFDRCDLNSDGAVDGFDVIYLDLALNGLVALI